MINTTADFQNKVKSKVRRWFVRATINYTDALLDPSINASSTDNARVSYAEQAVNGRLSMTYKWLSLDSAFPLSEGLHPAPGDETKTFNEFGWWNNELSGTSGVFSNPPELSISYSSRAVSGFIIAGDNKRLEYPKDIEVMLYNDTTLLYTHTVTDNTQTNRSVSFASVSNVNKVMLKINKWSHTGRQAKIAEFTTQVIEEYTGEALCGFSSIEQREISTNNSLPVGNIASSESTLCLSNSGERPFDYNNVNSRLYGLVKPNCKLNIELGLLVNSGVEYIPIFDGWIEDWNVPESGATANVIARDRLNLLTKTYFNTSEVIEGDTFYQWFEIVLNDAGLASTQYEISTTYQDDKYVIPYGWINNKTHREALRMLAEGCLGVVYQGRDGIIYIKPISEFDDTVKLTYTRDEYSDKNNQPEYNSLANMITVTTSPIKKTTGELIYETIEPFEIQENETKTFSIKYADAPVSEQIATINPSVAGISIVEENHYSWGSDIEVQNTNSIAKSFLLEVQGSKYEIKGEKTTTRRDSESIENNGEIAYNYNSNIFIQKKILAEDIADKLLASFKNPQSDVDISFRSSGNPSLELGDKIGITDLYQTINYYITTTEINFNGGLSINHRGRK